MTDATHNSDTAGGHTTIHVRPYQDRDRLNRLYHEEGLTQQEIANKFNIDRSTITRWMDRHEINTRRGNTEDVDGGGRGDG